MALIRSLFFVLFLVVFTLPYTLVCFAVFPFAPLTRYHIVTGWARTVMWFARYLLGIRYRVIGAENIPRDRTAVVLSKHQSAWETIAYQQILPPLCFVLKRELLRIPFFGWGLSRVPTIAIDRRAGKDALTQVLEQGRVLLNEGFCVVIFPEGTRVSPGETRRFKPGGAWLAQNTGAPVIPIAHNAGEFWGRNALIKYPGEITVSIGPPIETEGLSAAEINDQAASWMDREMRRLFPHHYDESMT